MTSRVAERISQKYGISERQATAIIKEVMRSVEEEVVEYGTITLPGVGTLSFKTVVTFGKQRYDVVSKEIVEQGPMHLRWRFRPTGELKARILEQQKEWLMPEEQNEDQSE